MKNHILKNSIDTLVDKVILYNFTVEDILDLDDLELQGIASVEKKANVYAETNSCQKYNHIHIAKCTLFDDFYYGRSQLTNEFFGKLELSVNNDGFHNLNCSTLYALKIHIKIIERYLADNLGILVNFENIKVKSIEINKTFELNENYENYHRVLKSLIYLLPQRLSKKKEIYLDNTNTYSFYSGNASEVLKIYSKTNQLNKKYSLNIKDEYVRFEITLDNKGGKIKDLFGTAILWDLYDEQINEYFNNFIEKNIITPFLKHQKYATKTICHLLSNEYKSSSHKWIENVLLFISDFEIEHNLPLLYNIEDIKPLLEHLHIKNKSTKYYIYNRFENSASIYSNYLTKNDKEKYREIIEKLFKKI